MKIEIDMHSAAPGVAGELRKFVEHHVRCSLAQVRLHVERVLVRLTDLNGPQGSFDQLCAVQVRIAGQRPVMVRDVRPDMRTAIARAVERAGLNSLRRLRQRQQNAWPVTGYQTAPTRLKSSTYPLRREMS